MELTSIELYQWLAKDQRYLTKLTARLPHALLLHGPRGLGIEHLTINWIYSLLCDNQQFGGCKTCQACTLIAEGSHPDLYQVTLDENSTKKTIGVEQIRAVTEFVAVTTHLAPRKIVLIEDANLLTLSSANALLKILEEPQPYVVFILLSNNIVQLLPTIKSRCIKHKIIPPSYEEAYAYLENKNLPNTGFWLRFYNNCPLFESEIDELQLNAFIQTLLKPSINNIYTLTQEFDGKTISFAFILDFISKWLSDVISYKMTAHLNYFLDYATEIGSLTNKITVAQVFYLQDALNNLRPWANHPLNYKLQIENLLFSYQQLFIKK